MAAKRDGRLVELARLCRCPELRRFTPRGLLSVWLWGLKRGEAV